MLWNYSKNKFLKLGLVLACLFAVCCCPYKAFAATASLTPSFDAYVYRFLGTSYVLEDADGALHFGYGYDGDNDYYYRSFVEWDLTSIPDTATITDVALLYSGYRVYEVDSSIYSMENRPSTTLTEQTLFDDAHDGTAYLLNNANFPETGDNKNVGGGGEAWSNESTLISDIQNALSRNWFAMGFYADETSDQSYSDFMTQIAATEAFAPTPKPTLYITYSSNNTPVSTTVSVAAQGVKVGSNVTFTGNWTESDSGDSDKLYICKDSLCTDCNSSSQTSCWCYSSAWTVQPTVTATCSYTALSADKGNRSYWLNTCDDDNACSSFFPYGGTFTVAPNSITALRLKGVTFRFKNNKITIKCL